MNAIRVLLWKEWREQRLTLLALALVVVWMGAGEWLAKSRVPEVWVLFCAAAVGLMLGVAGAEGEKRTLTFLGTSPIPLSLVWAVKTALSLVAALVMGGLTVAVFELVARGLQASSAHWEHILWTCLLCAGFSQYFAGWVRSPIGAAGLGLVAAAAILGMALLNPIEAYLNPQVMPMFIRLALVVGLAVLLWLGRAWFIQATRAEHVLSRPMAIGGFLLPVGLLGVLQLVLAVTVFVADAHRFDVSDVSSVSLIGLTPHDDSLLMSASPASKFWWSRPSRFWVPWQVPSLMSVSPRTGQARRILEGQLHPHYQPYWYGDPSLSVMSPQRERVLVRLRAPSLRADWRGEPGPWAVMDVRTGNLRRWPYSPRGNLRPLWLSEERLMFYFSDGRKHGWGTWDAQSGEVETFHGPSGLKRDQAWFSGFLRNPVRLAFTERLRPLEQRRGSLHLLCVDTGAVERIDLGEGYWAPAVSVQSHYALLSPEWDGGPQDLVKYPPRLLDLATGKVIGLESVLGGAPEGGWAKTTVRLSRDRSWLFVLPADYRRWYSSSWHAVDLRTLTVLRRPPRAPYDDTIWPSPSSELWAQREYEGFRVFPIREPNAAVTKIFSDNARPYRMDSVLWLSEHELAFSVSRFDPCGEPAVFIADLRAKEVRPLWPSHGQGLRWYVRTWTERESRRSGVLE